MSDKYVEWTCILFRNTGIVIKCHTGDFWLEAVYYKGSLSS